MTTHFNIGHNQNSEHVQWVSETALMLRSGERSSLLKSHEVLSWFLKIREGRFPEVQEIIPAADTVAILLKDRHASRELLDFLAQLPSTEKSTQVLNNPDTVEIEVAYGGSHGPDLSVLARHTGMSERDIIDLHSSVIYTVAFTGFAPGFGYMLGLPDKLNMPRRQEPRVEVPRGSVAIGGHFTGIYPENLPGGWNLIGRTEAIVWDITNNPPAQLIPGHRVRFKPI